MDLAEWEDYRKSCYFYSSLPTCVLKQQTISGAPQAEALVLKKNLQVEEKNLQTKQMTAFNPNSVFMLLVEMLNSFNQILGQNK